MKEKLTDKPSPNKSSALFSKQPEDLQESMTLTAIQEAIQSIRFGSVQIIIQDGRIVQIDKTEKIRLT